MNKKERMYDLANFAYVSHKARQKDPNVSNYTLAELYETARKLAKKHRRICESDCNTGEDTDTSKIEESFRITVRAFGATMCKQYDPRGSTLWMEFTYENGSKNEVFI